MSIIDLANTYIDHLKAGTSLEFVDAHYSEEVVSIEANAMPGTERITKGIDAIRGKIQWFNANFKVEGIEVAGPWPHGDEKYAVRMTFDLKHRESGTQSTLDEVAVFSVKDNKVVKEEFFFS